MAALPFLATPIDDAVARGMQSTPTVPGRVKRYTATGRLTQNYSSALPLHRFELSHGIKRLAQFEAIQALFYVVHFTPYAGFPVRDPRDFRLMQANSRLTFITGSTWQINRVYTYGGVDFLRPIQKPETGIVVKRTRSGVVSTATASVDTATGIATISGHVGGDTYTCEGRFYVPVTFSDDEWTAECIGSVDDLVIVSGQIKLEEIRL